MLPRVNCLPGWHELPEMQAIDKIRSANYKMNKSTQNIDNNFEAQSKKYEAVIEDSEYYQINTGIGSWPSKHCQTGFTFRDIPNRNVPTNFNYL